MFFVAGSVIVVLSVLGGHAAPGGKLYVLWQPFEVVIICGAAAGAFIISNRKPVLALTAKALACLVKGDKYDKAAYLELLSLLYRSSGSPKRRAGSLSRNTSRSPTRALCSRAFRSSRATITRSRSSAITSVS
ncbi:MAG TPA: motility-associated protein [Geminicoccaceae bacterium]|nr:motility-associated protein [Geminicoccaceae bacterium]